MVSKGSFSNGVFCNYTYLDAAAVAELGFIVVQLDTRGSSYRSKAFQDESYGRVSSACNVDDHVAGLKQLAKRHPYMDLDRLGISSQFGPGGVHALCQYPDLYKVGVTNTLHDSRLMPASMWGEKYEGFPGTTANQKYPEQQVENLKGKLFMVNGMLDFSNPPAGTFRVVEALQKANKDFDMLMLPSLGHDMPVSYVTRRIWDYLVANLMEVDSPKEYKLTTVHDIWTGSV